MIRILFLSCLIESSLSVTSQILKLYGEEAEKTGMGRRCTTTNECVKHVTCLINLIGCFFSLIQWSPFWGVQCFVMGRRPCSSASPRPHPHSSCTVQPLFFTTCTTCTPFNSPSFCTKVILFITLPILILP